VRVCMCQCRCLCLCMSVSMSVLRELAYLGNPVTCDGKVYACMCVLVFVSVYVCVLCEGTVYACTCVIVFASVYVYVCVCFV